MIVTIILCGLINSFLLGVYYESDYQWRGSIKEKLLNTIVPIIMLGILGCVVITFFAIRDYGKQLLIWLDNLTQIRTYWTYFVLGGWRSIPLDDLKGVNEKVEHYKKNMELSLGDRHFMYLLTVINKKREYTHQSAKSEA